MKKLNELLPPILSDQKTLEIKNLIKSMSKHLPSPGTSSGMPHTANQAITGVNAALKTLRTQTEKLSNLIDSINSLALEKMLEEMNNAMKTLNGENAG
ncbi:hypothetical protein CIPAW_14G082600 [Carya illinoinensis]|nr:hypothetical protein CIPAW_14G082600 [Carya illinoinensis]